MARHLHHDHEALKTPSSANASVSRTATSHSADTHALSVDSAPSYTAANNTAAAGYASDPNKAGERAKKKNRHRKNKRKLTVGTVIWRSIWGLIALCFGGLAAAYVVTPVPSLDSIPLPVPSVAYFADGTTKIGELTNPVRTPIEHSAIGEITPKILLAVNDPDFYETPAMNPKDLASEVWEAWWGGSSAQESSLSHRFGSMLSARSEQNFWQELQSLFLPLKIERSLSKDDIVTAYLNAAYFGRDAYGIEEAAKAYFGVSAADLDLAQSALLVAIMPSPSAWDPAIDKDQAQKQFTKVLSKLVAADMLTQEEAAGMEFPQVRDRTYPAYSGVNGHILSMVRSELSNKAGLSAATIEREGLSVVTTIDEEKQKAAVDAVASLPEDKPTGLQVGLFSANPRTGEVVAVYGGSDYAVRSTNAATQDRSAAGMTFSTFTMAEAFEQGVSANEEFYGWNGVRVDEEGSGYSYFNVNGKSYGLVNVQQMTKFAVNSAFVHLNGRVSPQSTKKRAVAMGISADAPHLNEDPGNVLGAAHVTGEEMARAYSALAADGVLPVTHVVNTARGESGDVVYKADFQGKRILKKESAQLATYALHSTFTGSEEAPLDLPGMAYTNGSAFDSEHPSAGQASSATDRMAAWFVGYTPQLVTSVNMFELGDDGSVRELSAFGDENPVTGSGMPLKVWSSFMTAASAQMKAEPLPDVTDILAQQR